MRFSTRQGNIQTILTDAAAPAQILSGEGYL